jgi:uncharacterized membrane protein YgcG
VGVAWLSFPLGLACAVAVCAVAIAGSGGGRGGAAGGGAAAATTTATTATADFAWGVALHGLAAAVELAVEPVQVAATARLELGLRAGIESAAAVSRCLVTLALLVLGEGEAAGDGGGGPSRRQPHTLLLLLLPFLRRVGSSPALTFGAAQLAASLVVAAGYSLHAWRLARSRELHLAAALRRGTRRRWDAQDREALRLSALFGVQAAEKLVLAEGSKLALVGAASWAAARAAGGRGGSGGSRAQQQQRAQQGAYGLVSNLGGLVARLLLQPLEEVAFAAFSRAAAAAAADQQDREEEKQQEEQRQQQRQQHEAAEGGRGEAAPAAAAATSRRRRVVGRSSSSSTTPASELQQHQQQQQQQQPPPQQKQQQQKQQQQQQQQQLAAALALLLRAVSLAGLLAALLGPWYSYSALRLAYGRRWADGPGNTPLALAAYCAYVAAMAVNGVAEAFSHAVLDARGLRRANAALVVFAALQVGLSVCAAAGSAHFGGGATWGAAALVVADACGMLPRLAFALACARRYFDEDGAGGGGRGAGRGEGGDEGGGGGGGGGKRSPGRVLRLRELFPSSTSLLAVAAASALAGASWRLVLHGGVAAAAAPPLAPSLGRVAAHVALGAALALVLAPVLWLCERGAMTRAGAEVLSSARGAAAGPRRGGRRTTAAALKSA